MALKIGDILPFELPETVVASVDGVPVMVCEYGNQSGKRALRINELIDHSPAPTSKSAAERFVKSPTAKEHQND